MKGACKNKLKNRRFRRILTKVKRSFFTQTADLATMQSVISKTPKSVLKKQQKAKLLSKCFLFNNKL